MMRRAAGLLVGRAASSARRRISRSAIEVSEPVQQALAAGRPVVALETAIVTHGMPVPHNLQTAQRLEAVVAAGGAVPATIGVVGGRIRVGLSGAELEALAASTTAIKVTTRDLPSAMASGLDAGTTVAATIAVAHAAGIAVMATGGLGGVHRGAESSMDVSADLVELGRTPVCVVCSGAKAILDLPRTLEVLETFGVGVATMGEPGADFPAFYWARSGCPSPAVVADSEEAARLAHAWRRLGGAAGLVIGVPVPEEAAGDSNLLEKAITAAVAEAEHRGIYGKKLTPFLLTEVNKSTKGAALDVNKALVINNARLATEISVRLANLETRKLKRASSRVAVVGGCAVDRVVQVSRGEGIVLDGATWPGSVAECVGGVGRNLAEAIGRLQRSPTPLLVSAVGTDRAGDLILSETSSVVDTSGVRRVDGASSATYEVLLDSGGECRLVIGADDVTRSIDASWVGQQGLEKNGLVVIDANVPIETLDAVLSRCHASRVPVWFEPTDARKAAAIISATPLWTSLSFTSPNLRELRQIAKAAGLTTTTTDEVAKDGEAVIAESVELASGLVEMGVANVIVTLGQLGSVIANRSSDPSRPFAFSFDQSKSNVSARFYPAKAIAVARSVSGAGDCFASALVVAASRGLSEETAVAWGMAAANVSLGSARAVPVELNELAPPPKPASYRSMR